MALTWEQVVVDARDPHALAHWWARSLDWVVTYENDDEVEIRPAPESAPESAPGLLFLGVPDDRVTKNRLHLDFRPTDQHAEVERLLELGATRCNIGQGDVSWIVLADPEGNEFCVLSSVC